MSEYLVDGADIDDAGGRWFVTSASELPTMGAPRNTSVEVPNRSGVLPLAPASVAPFTIAMKVCVTDAGTPGGPAGVDQNVRAFMPLVRRMRSLLRFTHRPARGLPRSAMVRLSSSVSQTRLDASTTQLSFTVEGPAGVWVEDEQHTMESGDLSAVDGGCMPATGVLLLAIAPGGRLTATDRSGLSLLWEGDSAGRNLLVDPWGYEARLVPGETWDVSQGTDVSSGLTLGPGGFALVPDATGHHSMTAATAAGGRVLVRTGRHF